MQCHFIYLGNHSTRIYKHITSWKSLVNQFTRITRVCNRKKDQSCSTITQWYCFASLMISVCISIELNTDELLHFSPQFCKLKKRTSTLWNQLLVKLRNRYSNWTKFILIQNGFISVKKAIQNFIFNQHSSNFSFFFWSRISQN